MNSDKLIKNANSLPTHPNKQNDDFNLSKLNSMDCWDYTIELECLQGPQGYYYYCYYFFTFLILYTHQFISSATSNLCSASRYVVFKAFCAVGLN